MALDPTSLHILKYPAPVLRKRAAEIPEVTAEVQQAALRMIELMDQAEGIGLAAPQVGLSWRLFVVHVPTSLEEGQNRSAETDPPTATARPRVYINPVLSDPRGPLERSEEGCLSLPEITGDIFRPTTITVTALDSEGRTFSHSASGLLARCIQHEFDHLEGVLILDRMTQISRLKSRAAVRRLERTAL
jgi:peptide deformylase